MRLWSLHPRYLDSKGLVALWREGLLAHAVLAGKTRGYRNHPQLARFLASPRPHAQIGVYLWEVHAESLRRGYRFDVKKLGRREEVELLKVTRGQLDYEWEHLKRKLEVRAAEWLARMEIPIMPIPHPSFRVVEGGVADWEVRAGASGTGRETHP